jgi:hypothetical protein
MSGQPNANSQESMEHLKGFLILMDFPSLKISLASQSQKQKDAKRIRPTMLERGGQHEPKV